MSVEVTLPELGESVTEGTVTRWLKNVGDRVEADEPLLEVSTDKVDTEVPSPVSGYVLQILAAEDDTVAVGSTLAVIGDSADAPATPDAPTAAPAAPAAATPEPAATPASPPASTAAPTSTAQGTPVALPELGESVTEGTVTRWLKNVGDRVEADEPLLEVSTDKVDTEVPSPVSGYVLQILAAEDDTVAVGSTLAVIGDSADAPATPDAPTAAPAAPAAATPEPAATPASPPASTTAPAAPSTAAPVAAAQTDAPEPYVTPIVRKLAADAGIDLASITGTGVGGRIRREDVMAAAEERAAAEQRAAAAREAAAHAAAAPAPAAAASPAPVQPSALRGSTVPFSRLRKAIAKSMVTSLNTQAQLTTVVEVDVTRIAQLRGRKKDEFLQKTGQKLSFMAFFAYAAVELLKQYPIINASVADDAIVYHDEENLAIAVDTERGLYAPVIKNAGSLSIAGFAQKIAEIAAKTRDNKLSPDDMSGGTFTLTNTGSRGALFDTPVVALPQSAILGCGTVVRRPAVVLVDGQEAIQARSMVYFSLSYDHRIIDGADAARYLSALKKRLEEADFEGALSI